MFNDRFRDFLGMHFLAAGSEAEPPRNSKGYVCDLPGINFCFKDEWVSWVGVIYYGKMYVLSNYQLYQML